MKPNSEHYRLMLLFLKCFAAGLIGFVVNLIGWQIGSRWLVIAGLAIGAVAVFLGFCLLILGQLNFFKIFFQEVAEIRHSHDALIEGQKWKFGLVGSIVFAIGLGIAWSVYLSSGVIMVEHIVATLIGQGFSLVGMAWLFHSVRCPQCNLRLLWYAVSKQGFRQWLEWPLKVKCCPRCGYHH